MQVSGGDAIINATVNATNLEIVEDYYKKSGSILVNDFYIMIFKDPYSFHNNFYLEITPQIFGNVE